MFPPDDFDLFAPAFVEGEEGPFDAGGEVAEDGFGGGVDAQGGGDQVKAGSVGGEAQAGEVAVALELAETKGGAGGGVGGLEVVPADANPVVKALKREVEIFVGFEFEDCEAVVGGDGEKVQHATVGGSEGWHLRVDVGGVEVWGDGSVEQIEIAAEGGLKPALGLHAVERVTFVRFASVRGGGAALEEASGEVAEVGGVVFSERGFVGSGTEADLLGVVKGVAGEAGADASELQTVEMEGELAGVAKLLLDEVAGCVGDESEDTGGGLGEAELCGLQIGRVEEAGGEVTLVGGFAQLQLFRGLVEFVELPLGGARIEPCEAGEGEGRSALRDDDLEALIEAAAGAGFSTVMQPEDAEGEDAVDGSGGFLLIDGDDSPGLLALHEGAARVGWAEGFLEVHGGAEGFWVPVGKAALEDAIEDTQVADAGGLAGAGSAAVFIGGELEGLGFGLAEALGGEAQDSGAHGGGGDATDDVALVRPEVEGAAAMLGGEGVLGEAHVEEDFAVFKQDRGGLFGEEGLEGSGNLLGGLLGFRCGCSGRGHVLDGSGVGRVLQVALFCERNARGEARSESW